MMKNPWLSELNVETLDQPSELNILEALKQIIKVETMY